MKKINILILMAIAFSLLVSCEPENIGENDENKKLEGILISCEGNFNDNNGSVSYFNQQTKEIENYKYYNSNGYSLGDVVQSVCVLDSIGFAVINNSQKIEVFSLNTYKSIATINFLTYPRYMVALENDKAYVTNGNFDGKVYIIDLVDYTISDSITVGLGPEKIISAQGKLLVTNSGGWGIDSTVSIIDQSTDKVIKTVNVGHCPVDIVADNNNDFWVLCKGKVVYDFVTFAVVEETPSKIVKLSGEDFTIIKEIEVGNVGDYFNPNHISFDGANNKLLYIENDGIYSLDMGAELQNNKPIIAKSFYGLSFDIKEGMIYGFQSTSFTTSGYMFRYTADGELVDSFKTGIAPNGAVFIYE